MKTLSDIFEKRFAATASFAEDELKKLFRARSDIPAVLKSAMEYSVFAGGKRLRPVIALASCELFSGGFKMALPFAAAIELIHTYSLIHDDLPCMDDDDFRRGRATNHKVYGEAMALLAGDALLNLAYEHLWECDDGSAAYRKAAAEIAFGAGSAGMVAGQSLDILSETSNGADPELLREIHLNKTAKLLTASAVSGACIGGADEAALEQIRNFALSLGLAFQIRDDILDVVGDKALLGKSVKKDGNKLTYPKAFGLEKSEQIAREFTEKALSSLNGFGQKGEFLRELTKFLLKREK